MIPGAYCIKLLPEKNSDNFSQSLVTGKFMLTRVFWFYQSYSSGKSFMQWAPDMFNYWEEKKLNEI